MVSHVIKNSASCCSEEDIKEHTDGKIVTENVSAR
jgi:hypothetical protein